MHPIPVSPAELCGTHLTDAKRRAIADYLKLGRDLQDREGRKSKYEPAEVQRAVARRGCDFDHISWAFAIYCAPEAFRQLHAGAGQDVSYVAMHGAVAGEFFQGDLQFDALTHGDAPQMPGVLGAPLDVDFGFPGA